MSTLLLVPLDDIVVFPNMNVTISADVADEERVLLVPRHDGEYAKVGTVAEVAERVRLPGGVGAVSSSVCTVESPVPPIPTSRVASGSRCRSSRTWSRPA